MIPHYIIRLVMLALLITSRMSYPTPTLEDVRPSLASYLHAAPSNNPLDNGWVADLTGLPDKDQVALLTQHVVNVMNEETNKQCASIDPNLRTMIFQHFVIYQHMANAQDVYFDEQIAHQWAHLLAMILKESSGDSTNITDMTGRSLKNESTDLEHWRNLFLQSQVQLGPQTNFGLTQLSADRLFTVFQLSKDQNYELAFLEGREGFLTPDKIKLNTAIATRRLIWFYQNFSEGRLAQSDWRIPQYGITNPNFSTKYQTALKMALLYCGTSFMFQKDPDISKLTNAMSSISYCKLGNPQTGYGVDELDEQCFAKWVTLCPSLNIDIANITPLSYFSTRKAAPICEETFKKLINPKAEEATTPGTGSVPTGVNQP